MEDDVKQVGKITGTVRYAYWENPHVKNSNGYAEM